MVSDIASFSSSNPCEGKNNLSPSEHWAAHFLLKWLSNYFGGREQPGSNTAPGWSYLYPLVWVPTFPFFWVENLWEVREMQQYFMVSSLHYFQCHEISAAAWIVELNNISTNVFVGIKIQIYIKTPLSYVAGF